MDPLRLAEARMTRRQGIARRVAQAVTAAWRRIDRGEIAASWSAALPVTTRLVAAAQTAAASTADEYLADLAEAYDVDEAADGEVNVAALAGVASDGRDLGSLLFRPAVAALGTIGRGGTVAQGLASGEFVVDMIVRTQVADAGRAADQVALAGRYQMTGYVRVLSLPSCSRCVVLAGRVYSVNAGFPRHPRCDCIHLPVPSASIADPLITQPRTYFDSLTEADQARVFTAAGAEAIRLGADIGQVVNARKGAAGLTPAGPRLTAAQARALRGDRDRGRLETRNVFGRDLYVTTEGAKRSGRPPRLMPESILQIAADDRAEAVRLLRRFGYLR